MKMFRSARRRKAKASAALVAIHFLSIGVRGAAAFSLQSTVRRIGTTSPTSVRMAVVEIGPTDDDVDPPLPGQMKIAEIKSELDLRGVSHSDCFDRESLETRLDTARSSGRSDPSIVDEFNRRSLEANIKGEKLEVSDEMIEGSVGGDGTLPGGMSPEMLKAMMADEELVTMLKSTKMQEIMKLVMSGGQEELEKAMGDDPEVLECVMKLNQIMGKINLS